MADNLTRSISNENRMDLAQRKEKANVQRSVFPYDAVHTTLINEGALVPVDLIETMPGDSFDLSNDVLVSVVNPFVDRMFSGMKLFIHAYYMKKEHIWKGFKNYATKGRRGNIELSLPFVRFRNTRTDVKTRLLDNGGAYNTSKPNFCQFDVANGLASYFGAPVSLCFPNKVDSDYTSAQLTALNAFSNSFVGSNTQVNRHFGFVSGDNAQDKGADYDSWPSTSREMPDLNALPFAMYQRVYRDYYLNKNLVKDNPLWFPDDDDDFILPYNHNQAVNCLSLTHPDYCFYSPVPNNNKFIATTQGSNIADGPILHSLRFRQYDGDIFTTGLPFLERGGVTSMFVQAISALKEYNKDTKVSTSFVNGELLKPLSDYAQGLNGNGVISGGISNLNGYMSHSNVYRNITSLGKTNETNQQDINTNIGVLLSDNNINELAIYSLWSRRNAHTDGDYSSMIRAHYDIDPRSEDRHPIYIGGSVQRLTFSEILQTSETANTPLGTQSSRAYSSGSASLGHFESPDFGYIMILASLIPDTYYNNGIPQSLDKDITGSELPFPEFNSLPPQPLLKKRLNYDGHTEELFSYVEPFIEYKYRNNRVSSLLAFNPSQQMKFGNMTFSRGFWNYNSSGGNGVEFNNMFVTAYYSNMNFGMYSVPSQPHYLIQYGSRVRAVRPMPYISKQATLANVS